jgi:hypothetical protein
MKKSCSKLLKEWGIVCKALGEGQQIFIARKGGIAEKTDTFVVENNEFFLYLSFFHQNRAGLKAKVVCDFDILRENQPAGKQIYLPYFAKVTDVISVSQESKIPSLSNEHIWNDSVLKSRFHYRNDKGFRIVVMRVYRLAEPLTIPLKESYAGCKSWVTLEKPLSIPFGMTPVLSDIDFFKKRQSLLKKL